MSAISACLERRFPGSGRRSEYRSALFAVCNDFLHSGLADPKFLSGLTGESDQSFWSAISEALVYDKLRGREFPTRVDIGKGPDFLLAARQKRLWIEVTCPAPSGVPTNWSNIVENQVISEPTGAILLRWTSAIKEKIEQLLGRPSGDPGYLSKGVVSNEDIYVIAVNGCRLRHGPFSALYGISQFPYAAEAVFSIGPLVAHINSETLNIKGIEHRYRGSITNHNGSPVPCATFLDPQFKMISAIWAIDFNGSSTISGVEPSALIHNPFAANPLPKNFLPSDREYVATIEQDGHFLLERITYQ